MRQGAGRIQPSTCPGSNKPGHVPGLASLAKRGSGFTLTELIVVIVMVGILVAVTLPRWRGETGFEERGFRDETAAALRYAQKAAVAARRRVCVTFTATSVSASMDSTFGAADCSVAVIGPSGDPLLVTAAGSAVFSPTPGNMNFDPLGRPNGGVTINIAGLAGLPVTVEAGTGYVH